MAFLQGPISLHVNTMKPPPKYNMESESVEKWRRFNFFDREVLKDPSDGKAFEKLKDVQVSACTCGRGQMIFGDIEGNFHFINRQLELATVKAYEIRVSHLYQLKQHNILVSIGEDEEGINPLIKVWNLDKIDRMGNPTCSRIVRAIPGNKPARVSCLCVHENLNYMVVGFETGAIVLFKGDVTRERHSKQKVIYEGTHCITGLVFKPQNRNSLLYITTTNHVMCMNIGPKEKDYQQTVLDQHGCSLHCSVMSDPTQDNQFVIGRPEALYFYQTEGRGPCLAFEGQKLHLHWFRGYLVVVGKEKKPIPMAGPTQTIDMHLVTVYDIKNKFIAFSGPVPDVVDVLSEWGSLYVLAGDMKLYQLQEKDTQTKLEILFKKNLYQLAIDLAQGQQYDQDGIIDIFRQYGDHLYGKGDHDGAIQQYIRTIGKLEASYVIRKFLDAQRIHNLTAYLQALHQAHLATEDHTTLLLNCYTKLKDVTKLDEFIMTKDREIDFDVETAIKVCRAAGYCKHAINLAETHKQHNWYLKIQLEDIKDYEKALDYMGKLVFEEAESNLKKYGKEMMSEIPKQTTEFLKRLCTEYKPSDEPLMDAPAAQKANAEEFIHIFVNNSAYLTEFLEHMIKVHPTAPSLVYNTLLELYLHELSHEKEISARVEKERKTLALLQTQNAKIRRFLFATKSSSKERSSQIIVTDPRRAGYDLDHALVLCQMQNFKAGILYLYEKAKLYQQILRYHMEHGEHIHIMDTCKKFGAQDPNLWIQALSYFARKEENCKPQIMEVLAHIDKMNLLPPILVIQTLAHNSTATLSVIKEYIIKRLQAEKDQIDEDERLIEQYQAETAKIKSQIEDLKTSATVFNVAKCSVCSHALELPSVHFLCQHSYHQHCFESYAENEAECPACLPDNRKVLDIIRAQSHGRDLHEQFHKQLHRAPDGFSVVADYFGRGVFNKIKKRPLDELNSISFLLTQRMTLITESATKPKHPAVVSPSDLTNPFKMPVSMDPTTQRKIQQVNKEIPATGPPVLRQNYSQETYSRQAFPQQQPSSRPHTTAKQQQQKQVPSSRTQPPAQRSSPAKRADDYPKEYNPFE